MTVSSQGASEERREPFVSRGDRPETELNLDTPLSELRLRDLRDILGGGLFPKSFVAEKSHTRDRYYKVEPEYPKSWKLEKIEKFETPDKWWMPDKWWFEVPVDPRTLPGPDPRLEQIIQEVSGIGNQVNQLADQVAELQSRLQG